MESRARSDENVTPNRRTCSLPTTVSENRDVVLEGSSQCWEILCPDPTIAAQSCPCWGWDGWEADICDASFNVRNSSLYVDVMTQNRYVCALSNHRAQVLQSPSSHAAAGSHIVQTVDGGRQHPNPRGPDPKPNVSLVQSPCRCRFLHRSTDLESLLTYNPLAHTVTVTCSHTPWPEKTAP